MKQERDPVAEALARKALVDRLVGRPPTKTDIKLRPSSVVQKPKKKPPTLKVDDTSASTEYAEPLAAPTKGPEEKKPSPTLTRKKRFETAKEPRRVSVEPEPVPEEGASAPKVLSHSRFDIKVCAQRAFMLTERDKELVEDALQGNRTQGLTEQSFHSRLSGICTKIGIPTTNRHEGYNRRGALRMVWERYLRLSKETRKLGTEKAGRNPPTQAQERELLELYRRKEPREREDILNYIRSLK